mgnify:CR=1 FL=1
MKIFLRSGRAVLLGGFPGFPPVLHAGDDDGAGGVAGDVDGLPCRGDATLDKRATRDFRVGERDDVARLGLAEVVADLLGEHHVAGHDSFLHGARGDFVGREHERAQRPGKPQDEGDHDNDAEEGSKNAAVRVGGVLTCAHEVLHFLSMDRAQTFCPACASCL